MKFFSLFVIMMVSMISTAFGQDAFGGEILSGALAFLDGLTPATIATVAVIVEVVLRFVPTQKTLSFIKAFQKTIDLSGKVLIKASEVIGKIAPKDK